MTFAFPFAGSRVILYVVVGIDTLDTLIDVKFVKVESALGF